MEIVRILMLLCLLKCIVGTNSKNEKSAEQTDTKRKTEKRDSSDKTTYVTKLKDEPFRPSHQHRDVGADPQAFYEKANLVGGIQYAATPVEHTKNEPLSYAVHPYRLPLRTGLAPLQKLESNPLVASPSYLHGYVKTGPRESVASPSPGPHPTQQIQYIIAIPLSYLRQFQQQLVQPVHQTVPVVQPARYFNGEPMAQNQPPHVAYNTQYIQVPANLFLAAARAASEYQRKPHSLYQAAYQQPVIDPQEFAEQQPKQNQLYAYPHQHQADARAYQQQPKQIQNNSPVAKAHPQIQVPALVHYNPIYVQPPIPQQQAQPVPQHYIRYSQGNVEQPSLKLSAPSALLAPQYYRINPQYYTDTDKMMFVNTQTALPFYHHPAGTHYGTHLYQPNANSVTMESVSIQPKKPQSVNAINENSSAGNANVVKYP